MSIEPSVFRDALGRFASGVTVVSARASDGRPVGVTVSSLSSLSLEPPLILFCLGKRTADLDAYAAGGSFIVNILAENQSAVSEAFANPGIDKFRTVAHQAGKNGCPLLEGCLANLECTLVAHHEGGDHLILVGRVERVLAGFPSRPLVRFRGQYARLGLPL